MSIQQIMRWEHDFLRLKGGGYSNLWSNGENTNVKGRTHQTINYLSCFIHPIIYYCQKLVELFIAWDGKGMEIIIRIGNNTHFWKNVFWLMSQVNAQNCFPFLHAFTFSSFLTFLGSFWTFFIIHPSLTLSSHIAEPSWVFILHVFSCFLISPCQEIRLFLVAEWMASNDSQFVGS